ncbi:hypothetical protein HZY83_07605 [Gemella sp. GH3]|uniref:hypothetical protein n=1 Tax=unclassified Gemella TaxID=2624949 RepID=UPI0015CFBADA|nr:MULTISPECIES: hypothetical protein [unclassified Gemella]MBF0714540.1 hypothetical protein [Gemella sp. GH3.1]NYS51492.1 hypothetical protein [Gemella sp. GH3]
MDYKKEFFKFQNNEIVKNKIGEVIEIIDEKRIIISIGEDDGLKKGDKILIYVLGPEIIKDDISYGTLDKNKETVEVVETYPKMSICSKITVKIEKPSSNLSILTETLREQLINNNLIDIEHRVVEDLDIEENYFSDELAEFLDTYDKTINIGDKARVTIDKDNHL